MRSLWLGVVAIGASLVLGGCGRDGTTGRAVAAGTREPARGSGAPPGSPAERSTFGLGFVLLRRAAPIDPTAVVRAYTSLAPEGPALRVGKSTGDDLDFTLGDGFVVVSLMPAPVPQREAEDHARFSFAHLADRWQPPAYGAHLTVVGKELGATALDRARTYHRVLAAITTAVGDNAVGVYHSGAVTHDPAFYTEAVAESPDAIIAWCGISVARDGDRLSLLSIGMAPLGVPDVLATYPASTPAVDAVTGFFDVLLYAARRGEPLPAGDTVGRGGDEKVPVVYQASPIDPSVQVIRLDFP